MSTASIRDLRTQFPRVRRKLDQEGEIVVTDRGRPIMVLRPYDEPPTRREKPFDFYARLRRRMPKRLSEAQRRELEEAERGER